MDRRVSLPDVDLALLEAGEGGRPLLLVHGFGGAKEDFADHVDSLAERGWHVVAPDLRGHGASDGPPGEEGYSLDVFADDLEALVDRLGWTDATLLGHSMGGMVAQVLVLRAPTAWRGLVLMDTGHGRFEVEPEALALGLSIVREKGLAEYARLLTEVGDPLENPAAERVLRERPGYQEFCDAKMLACSPDMYAAMMEQLTSLEDRLPRLGELTLPTLVLVGEYDRPFLDPSRAMCDALPDARFVLIADAGHSPQFEAPEPWIRAVEGFLDELAAGPLDG